MKDKNEKDDIISFEHFTAMEHLPQPLCGALPVVEYRTEEKRERAEGCKYISNPDSVRLQIKFSSYLLFFLRDDLVKLKSALCSFLICSPLIFTTLILLSAGFTFNALPVLTTSQTRPSKSSSSYIGTVQTPSPCPAWKTVEKKA